MIKKIIVFTFIAAFILNPLFGQKSDTLRFSLHEAREYALANNLNRKNAAIDVVKAQKKVWETTASGLPQVSGGFDFQLRLDEIPKLPFGPPDPNDPEQKPTMVEISERSSATYNITVSQLVFSGPYIVGLRASKAFRQLSELSLEKTDVDLKAAVTSAYYLVLLMQETLATLDSSVANMGKTLLQTKKTFEAGFAAEVAVDQLSVALSMLKNQQQAVALQLAYSVNLLKFQMGLPGSQQIALTNKLDDFIAAINTDSYRNEAFNPNANVEMRILDNNVKIGDLQVMLEKSSFLPSVSAYLTYQKLLNEPAINFTPTALFGFGVSVPIFSSGVRMSKVQQAKLSLEQAHNSYNQVLQTLEIEYNDALNQYTRTLNQYSTAKENSQLAQKVYRNVTVKFHKGVASQTDLIQANDKYLEATSTYTQTVVDLLSAKLRLDKVLSKL